MVKGVNKTVIEVNNTGSKFFEKIVFYVTPEYGNLSAGQLKRAAENFSFNFEENTAVALRNSLRKRHKRKKRVKLLSLLGVGCIVFAVILAIIL